MARRGLAQASPSRSGESSSLKRELSF